jgi:tetratricopeptide (TPR) repeat protein
MAYNKTKLVETAQKYLNQGKIAQAIGEYQQVLRQEPKDQITLMTIGDLFVRQGETFQALEYFERLAQAYLNEGFVTKAIAIYKKIAKLAPEETKPLERLAELYVQQGVMSEARPIYVQLAEVHLKSHRHPQAVALLRKLLEAEPDNLRVRTRLADLYAAIGQEKEAAEAYLGAAQLLFERGEHAEAEKLAERALKIESGHPGAVTLKARAMVAGGKRAEATSLLETLQDLDSGSSATILLVEQYLLNGQPEPAATLAHKVSERNPKNYELTYKVGAALLDAGELDRALELLGQVRQPMTEAGDHERLSQALIAAAERLPGRLEPREWLVDLYSQASDTFRLPDALAQLAEAAAASGQFDRAKQAYEQLLERNPDDESARRRLNQVRTQLGLEPLPEVGWIRPDTPSRPLGEPLVAAKPGPPAPEPALDEETQSFINQSLTDVDLFSSYGLTQKAMDLLEHMLERAPRHTVTLEKLLDLCLGAGNDRRTADLAGQLEQIHLDRGDVQGSGRFSELRRRFQRAAGLAAEELSSPKPQQKPEEFLVPTVEAELVPQAESQPALEVAAVPLGEPLIHEVDLSEEWSRLSHQVEEPLPAPPPAAPQPDLRAAAPPEPATAVPAPAEQPAPEYELELQPVPTEIPSAPEPAEPDARPTVPALTPDQFLAQLSAEFDGLVPNLMAPVASAPIATEKPVEAGPLPASVGLATPGSQPAAMETSGPLREVFEEFRAELGEMGAEEEDLETHYNLGIAYREMGLLEEAIGEFQKVAKASDKGRAFRYAMQCCTLLGLAFMEKGQASIAVIWYERALQTPGLDQESILALRYDLGIAQEVAGDQAAALKSFSQVYGMNIDYRDVAERIALLGKQP